MSLLALVRHGEVSGRDLSTRGERQAAVLGRELRDLAAGRPARVVTSPAVRARATASIICSFLGLAEPREERRLWSGPDGAADSWDGDLSGLSGRLDDWQAGVGLLVVVTHYEICAGLPALLAFRHRLAGRLPGGLSRGQALVVDPHTSSWSLLPAGG